MPDNWRWKLFPFFILLFASTVAWADTDDVVPYDDLEAAGAFEYGDTQDEPAAAAEGAAEESEAGSLSEWEDDFALAEASSDESADKKQEQTKSTAMPWEMGAKRSHPNMIGTYGLMRIAQAKMAPPHMISVGMHMAWFKYSDYLIFNDKHTSMTGNLHVAVAILEFLEAFIDVESAAVENNKETPSLFQTIGDLRLGVKGGYTVLDWLSVGGLVDMLMMNSVGEVGFDMGATSVGITALATVDFDEITQRDIPIRGHLNLGYIFDNSANLVDEYESDRGGCGSDRDGDGLVEYQGCLSPVERTALNINRVDTFRIGLGFDAALPYVSPMVEYNLDIPINRQGFKCPKGVPGSYDSCLEQEGFSAFRQSIVIGARVLPPVNSLSLDVAVEIGLTGYAPSVHELSAQAPYRIMFGFSYGFDPTAQAQCTPIPEEPVTPAPDDTEAALPRLEGYVHDSNDKTLAVVGASIEYVGMALSPQQTDKAGRFTSYELQPGASLTLAISAEGYKEGTCVAMIPLEPPPVEMTPEQLSGEQPMPVEPQEWIVQLDCPLEALPKQSALGVQVVSEEGDPMPDVELKIVGKQEHTVKTDASGRIDKSLDPGAYMIIIDNELYLRRQMTVKLELGKTVEVQLALRPRPKKASVTFKQNRIVIKKKIQFKVSAAEIDENSYWLVDEIADILLSNPHIKKVEIQGHTDNSGSSNRNMKLSQARADSVREYLIAAGVEPARLIAKGYGQTRPIAPNITASSRARNRRVEFHIIEREKPAE